MSMQRLVAIALALLGAVICLAITPLFFAALFGPIVGWVIFLLMVGCCGGMYRNWADTPRAPHRPPPRAVIASRGAPATPQRSAHRPATVR
jgi:hypothetical protein